VAAAAAASTSATAAATSATAAAASADSINTNLTAYVKKTELYNDYYSITQLGIHYYDKSDSDAKYMGAFDKNFTLGTATTLTGQKTTQSYQNLIIGTASTTCTSTFNGYVYLKDYVNPTTTLIIGAFNSVGETTANSLNIYIK
jgi:hypothetical protein